MQKVDIRLVDRKVARAQKSKRRIGKEKVKNAKNKSIHQSKHYWLKTWKSWAFKYGYDKSIQTDETGALKKFVEELRQQFVRKTGMISSVIAFVQWLLILRKSANLDDS